MDVLDQRDVEGRTMGSRWTICQLTRLHWTFFETSHSMIFLVHWSSKRYYNARCGLIDIKNTSENASHGARDIISPTTPTIRSCFRTEKGQGQIQLRGYGILVDYKSIESCAYLNKLCICVHNIDEDSKIRRSKAGKVEYLALDRFYLLRIQHEYTCHYI